jgi:hypothetical protein
MEAKINTTPSNGMNQKKTTPLSLSSKYIHQKNKIAIPAMSENNLFIFQENLKMNY